MGSVVAQSLCRYLECHTCAQLTKPKTPRPGKVPTDGVQFNEVVQMDLFHIHDAAGTQAWFMATVDLATDYVTVRRCGDHTSAGLWQAWGDSWLSWAGPPDVVVTDNERGIISEEMVKRINWSGTALWPTAAYASWQKGRIERRI